MIDKMTPRQLQTAMMDYSFLLAGILKTSMIFYGNEEEILSTIKIAENRIRFILKTLRN